MMAHDYPAKFIHFGLPKCGSTFLQNVWGVDDQYTGVSLAKAANAARQLALTDNAANLPRVDLGARARVGTSLVASAEGFSWAYLGRPAEQDRIADLHRLAARMTGQVAIAPVALFMVRNPVGWIRSTHEQVIRRGDHDTGQAYLVKHRTLIERVLDLHHIREVFGQHFERVVFLSSDEMRDQPDQFWDRYEAELDVLRPARQSIERVTESERHSNASLQDRMVPMARMNRVLSGIMDAWAGIEGAPPTIEKEREVFGGSFDKARVWAARRVSEYSSADQIEALLGGAFAEMTDGFTDLPLDGALKSHLRRHFCDVIDTQDTIPEAMKDSYRAALA
ncbi:hypothetical protein [Maricaulis maris]|uniref:hypothetical protein n=1 Tax=Maricaulis maris TaxID=74318 RepID=UPI003B8C75FC